MVEKLTWHQQAFMYTLYLSWILYAFSLVAYFGYHLNGITELLDQILKIYIGLILIYKFNPLFGKGNFTNFDKRLAWHAGFFLLISTILTSVLKYLFGTINVTINETINETINKYLG